MTLTKRLLTNCFILYLRKEALQMKKFLTQLNNDSDFKMFKTPILIEKDCEYQSALEHHFNNLYNIIKKNNAPDSFLNELESYNKILSGVITKYYKGDLGTAQIEIYDLIKEFDNADDIGIANIENSYLFKNAIAKGREEIFFYRARINSSITDYTGEEMLHIPFNQRCFAKSGRFSIYGLPCIYLGTTSYVCWLEMDRPADHEFNVSAFRLPTSHKILNLAVNKKTLLESSSLEETAVLTIFKLFLLSIATSFKVKETNRVFKSEYIISQLIMLSAKKLDLSGVAYNSKRVTNDYHTGFAAVDLALLANYEKGFEVHSAFCDEIFSTPSYNFSMFKQLNSRAQDTHREPSSLFNHAYISSLDRCISYSNTEFFRFDQFLMNSHYNQDGTLKSK